MLRRGGAKLAKVKHVWPAHPLHLDPVAQPRSVMNHTIDRKKPAAQLRTEEKTETIQPAELENVLGGCCCCDGGCPPGPQAGAQFEMSAQVG